MTVPIPPGPPFDTDVLADLQAGVYPPEVAAELLARARRDPQASAVLAALDATVADLRALPARTAAPIPPPVAARLDAAIAAESAARTRSEGAAARARFDTARSDTARSDTARSGPARRRPVRWATGLGIAAAVAAVFTVGAIVLRPGGTAGTGMAGERPGVTTVTGSAAGAGGPADSGPAPGTSAGASAGTSAGTSAEAPTRAVIAEPHHLTDLLPQIDGSAPQGPFGDPARLAACLAANGAAGQDVLGVLPVSYTGEQAYAISLRFTDDRVRVIVVGPQCGATGADLMEEQTTTG